MPTEVGNLSRLAFILEPTFGAVPTTPTGQIIRQTGFDLSAERQYIDNPELRIDGMVQAGRGGALRGKGSISGKLSYGTYDSFFAAALGNYAWNANVAKVRPIIVDTATTLTVATATTITRPAGDFTADGFQVGDYINTSGFVNVANNGTFIITAVVALTITCAAATWTTAGDAANANAGISLSTRPSFTMERAHLVNGIYFAFPGCVVDGFEMSGKVNNAVDVKFNILSKSVATEATTSVFTGGTTAMNTNPLMTAWDGSVKIGGTTVANVVGWDLKSTRNLDTAEVVGSSVLYDIQPKAQHVTGTMELYFADYSLYTAMRAETDLTLQLNLGPGGTLSYTVDLTRVRIKTWKSVPKDGLMTAQVEFESFAPISGTNTSLMLTRLP